MIGAPINDELFSADVEQLLVPNVAPDEIVVLDNPGAVSPGSDSDPG